MNLEERIYIVAHRMQCACDRFVLAPSVSDVSTTCDSRQTTDGKYVRNGRCGFESRILNGSPHINDFGHREGECDDSFDTRRHTGVVEPKRDFVSANVENSIRSAQAHQRNQSMSPSRAVTDDKLAAQALARAETGKTVSKIGSSMVMTHGPPTSLPL